MNSYSILDVFFASYLSFYLSNSVGKIFVSECVANILKSSLLVKEWLVIFGISAVFFVAIIHYIYRFMDYDIVATSKLWDAILNIANRRITSVVVFMTLGNACIWVGSRGIYTYFDFISIMVPFVIWTVFIEIREYKAYLDDYKASLTHQKRWR